MGFISELEKTHNKAFTENGDVSYLHITKAGNCKHNLEFFGLGGAMRNRKLGAKDLFGMAFKENEKIAMKNLLYLRDCRGGKGERELFRICLQYLAETCGGKIRKILPYVIEYGRGDDLLILVDDLRTRKETCDFIKEQMETDLEKLDKGEKVSLLAKWLPKPNATSDYKRRIARIIAEGTGMCEKDYRKRISALRKSFNLLETALTEQKYDFEYDKLPSQAMMKHTGYGSFFAKERKNAFLRNDEKRFREYLEGVFKGKRKMNVQTLAPYQVFNKVFSSGVAAEAQWITLKKRIPETAERIIVVRDGSGSMCGRPNEIATSLAILASESLTGEFKDKFITFSEIPRLVDLSGAASLVDKIRIANLHADCENTNIEAVYDLILKISLRCRPEDYISKVVVISDMQFDCGASYDESTFDTARRKFKEAGILFPVMTYWNVNARNISFPSDRIDGVQFVSGYSDAIYMSILKSGNVNAVELMEKTLKPYEKVAESWGVE